MNRELVLIQPRCPEAEKSARLRAALDYALQGEQPSRVIEYAEQLQDVENCRLLFAVSLGSSGINLHYYAMLKRIRQQPQLFNNCLAALIVDGWTELYTKYIARELALAVNMSGCALVGRPLVEGTGSLQNQSIIAHKQGLSEQDAYLWSARDVVHRLLAYQPPSTPTRLAIIHASEPDTSNAYALWQLVEPQLGELPRHEVNLRREQINDCRGCSYETCLHFSEHGGCFYGGAITDAAFPLLEQSSDLLLLCPNYNDALSANLAAFINRLTAMYVQGRLADKRLWGIIVSGYSGSDILAGQLIAGLCMNKGFYLPPRFCLQETAHAKGSILGQPGIEQRATDFAARIRGDAPHST